MDGVPQLIAVVDDEETVRRALRRLLRSLGYAVAAFQDGDEFLGWMAHRRPDCVLLDLHMPRVDGFEVLERLRALRPAVPVVVITGRDTPESRARAGSLDADAYLRKPVERGELIDAIRLTMESRA